MTYKCIKQTSGDIYIHCETKISMKRINIQNVRDEIED